MYVDFTKLSLKISQVANFVVFKYSIMVYNTGYAWIEGANQG